MPDVHERGWYSVMQQEINSLHENHTYDLMKFHEGSRDLRNKCVFKLKTGEYGCPPRYRARIMVKGFRHKKGCRL